MLDVRRLALCALLATSAVLLAAPAAASAQTFPTDDPVIRAIWREGMGERSRSFELAQALVDSIGPRLMGSPAYGRAADWLIDRYAAWGITAERQEYGTWTGWERGVTHVDLVRPRVRTLDGTMLAWSAGTDGPVEADVVLMPRFDSAAEFDAWLPSVAGRIVAISLPEPTCRPDESWERWGTPESFAAMRARRDSARGAWTRALRTIGADYPRRIEAAGAVAVLTGRWSEGWGADKIFSAPTPGVPAIHLACEDYGLVARLAERGQSPRIRLEADAEFLGDVPAFNVVGRIEGTELPDEYVVLSAHLDSWDGASGATDNGTGTVMMLEAMRILKEAYPDPRRTILVGHWGGEEQGLIGSTAFVADHPGVVEGLQAAFKRQDRLRGPAQQRDPGRDAGVPGFGGPRAGPFGYECASERPSPGHAFCLAVVPAPAPERRLVTDSRTPSWSVLDLPYNPRQGTPC